LKVKAHLLRVDVAQQVLEATELPVLAENVHPFEEVSGYVMMW
jgi:hypothetical protein